MVSRNRAVLWTLLALVPHILLLGWMFHQTQPAPYLQFFYGVTSDAWNPVFGLPAGVLVLCGAFAWLSSRVQAPSLSAPEPRRSPAKILTFLMLALVLVSPAFAPEDLRNNILRASIGPLILACGVGIGLRVLPLPWVEIDEQRTATIVERGVLSAAIGLGVLALLVFVLGTLGVMSPRVWWAIVLVLTALNGPPLWAFFKRVSASVRTFTQRHHPIATAAVAFVAVMLIAHLPMIWAPPLDYDVLEYHLAGPAEFFHDGRIHFLSDNLLASMPSNSAMLSLLPMILLQDPLLALPAAHFLIIAAWGLTAAGIYALVIRLVAPMRGGGMPEADAHAGLAPVAGGIAALLYMVVPKGTSLASDFFVEHLQAFFHVTAILAAAVFLQERAAGVRRCFGWLMLSGALCGFGVGAKYPALLFTFVPTLLFLSMTAFTTGSLYEALRVALCLTAAGLAAFSPWLLRNLAAAGDGLYPLTLAMQRRIHGSGGAVPSPMDVMDVSVRPGPSTLTALGGTLKSLFPGFGSRSGWLNDGEMGPHLLAWLPAGIGALRVFPSRATAFMLVVFGWDLVAWFSFSHRVDRFLYPCFPILAVLCGLGVAAFWSLAISRKLGVVLVAASVLVFAPLGMGVVSDATRPDLIAGVESAPDAARKQHHAAGNGDAFESWRVLNSLPEGSRALMIGDAQTFYLDRTPLYWTVFNESPLVEVLRSATSGGDAAKKLRMQGITHILINAREWARLDRTYALQRSQRQPEYWERALPFEPGERSAMVRDLIDGKIAEYGSAWGGADVFPAFLPLQPEEYDRLEDLLVIHSKLVWSSELTGHAGIEIRELQGDEPLQPRIGLQK